MVSRKPPEFPLVVAKAFVRAMEDYFAEESPTRRDAIAAHQLSVLRDYQGPRDKPLKLSDVKRMFLQMRNATGDKVGGWQSPIAALRSVQFLTLCHLKHHDWHYC